MRPKLPKEIYRELQKKLIEAKDIVSPHDIYTANEIEDIQIKLFNRHN